MNLPTLLVIIAVIMLIIWGVLAWIFGPKPVFIAFIVTSVIGGLVFYILIKIADKKPVQNCDCDKCS